jgi:hypothetical protein
VVLMVLVTDEVDTATHSPRSNLQGELKPTADEAIS